MKTAVGESFGNGKIRLAEIFICMLGSLLVLGLGATATSAAQSSTGGVVKAKPGLNAPLQGPAVPQPKLLADLVVTLGITADKYVENGKTCYNLHPKWTIANNGKAGAGTFKSLLEYKNTTQGWLPLSEEVSPPIAPQARISTTKTAGGNDQYRQKWCVGDSFKPGYRITVDSGKVVHESNENNNSATAYYP